MRTVIKRITRLKNTVSGNPRWKFETDHGTFTTKPDSMIGFVITETMVGRVAEISHYRNTILDVRILKDGD